MSQIRAFIGVFWIVIINVMSFAVIARPKVAPLETASFLLHLSMRFQARRLWLRHSNSIPSPKTMSQDEIIKVIQGVICGSWFWDSE